MPFTSCYLFPCTQEDRQRGGNPWGPAERGQGSPGSHSSVGAPFSDSPRGARRLPSLPFDDRNPFVSEVQQIFRQPRDVLQIYRKSPSSPPSASEPSGSRPNREGSLEKSYPGTSSRPSPSSLYSRVKSPDADAVSFYRKTSPPPRSSQSEAASSPQKEAGSPPRETLSPKRETVSPQRESISPQREAISTQREVNSPQRGAISLQREGNSPLREAGEYTASSVRRRGSQPVSPTAVGLLAKGSSVDRPAGNSKNLK